VESEGHLSSLFFKLRSNFSGIFVYISSNELAGFRVAHEILTRKKLPHSCEPCPSFGKRIYLRDPQRAAVVKASEDIETQLHGGLTRYKHRRQRAAQENARRPGVGRAD
jgi:hypothetical protein